MSTADVPTVFGIGDNAPVRAAMQRPLKSVSLHVESFSTPEDFLRRKIPNGRSCLVLDVYLQCHGHEIGCGGLSNQAFSGSGPAGCNSVSTVARCCCAATAERNCGTKGTLCKLDGARARGDGPAGFRYAHQADRVDARDQRNHGDCPPRRGSAQDAS